MINRTLATAYIKIVKFFQTYATVLVSGACFVGLSFLNHIPEVEHFIFWALASVGIDSRATSTLDDITIALIAWTVYLTISYIKTRRPRIFLSPEEVNTALDNNRIEVVVQPVYRLKTNMIVGFECLARLHHPQYGIVMPHEFLDNRIFAHTDTARRLTSFVLDRTAEFYQLLHADGYDMQMTVNLFSSDLVNHELQHIISRALVLHDVPYNRLTVEISEGAIINDSSQYLKVVNSLGNTGIKISLDDYGVRITSFVYFKDMKADGIKLDRQLITHIESNEHNREMVQSMIHGAHSLGAHVTAKHVEQQTVVSILRELDCDYVQGYVIAPPMPFEQAREWIKTRKAHRISKS